MKRLVLAIVFFVALLGTVACTSAQKAVPAEEPITVPSAIPSPVPAAAPGFSFSSPEVAPGLPPTLTVPQTPTQVITVDSSTSFSEDRMIVRTGDMALVVSDVAGALEQIAALATNYDGYVVSSNSWREGDRLVGNISVRVAAERFDDATRALRQLAVEVNSESTTSTDVTEEYVDLSAKLKNFEASEAQLLVLMEKAGSVEEILEVQRELTSTRGEIEQTKGRMQYLEQTSSMSLINVRLEQAELDVNFSASNRAVKEGQSIRFEPRIGGGISPYSYEWDYGDGETSTEYAPLHAYNSGGVYTVSLKVTDDRGSTDEQVRDNYIEVLPGWSAGNTVSSAWNGLKVLGHLVVDILIWVVYLIPAWIVILVILYFAWWRRRKKS